MKKFTSILCALAIVLSASAAPLKAAKAVKKTPSAKIEKIEKKVQDARLKELNQFVSKTPKKAPQAMQATTNVEILRVDEDYDADYQEYLYVLYGEDRYFIFAFSSTTGNDPVVLGQTYSLSDFAEAYWYISTYNWSDFTACSFVKTQDAEGNVKIVATATDEEGDVWNMSYDEASIPELPAGGSYTAIITSADYYTTDIQYCLEIPELSSNLYCDIYLAAGSKDVTSGVSYGLNDMDLDYTGFSVFKQNVVISSLSFTKTVAADGSYTLAIVIVDENNNTWNISASKAAASVVNMSLILDGELTNGAYYCQVEAANADGSQYVSLIIFGSLAEGAIDFEDLLYPTVTLTKGEDELVYAIQDIDLMVAYDAEKSLYTISGTMFGVNEDDDLDQINFTVTLTIAAPDPVVVVPSDMTFSFKYDGENLSVTPSNEEDPWDGVIISEETFLSIGSDADYVAEYIYDERGDSYAYPGGYTYTVENLELEPGSYVLVVWGANGGVTTPGFAYAFNVADQETGVANTKVSGKAAKRLVNGQLLIEKGNALFNANGILVK